MAYTMTHKEIAKRLLDALERLKAWLGTSEVDDLISAAEKNVKG